MKILGMAVIALFLLWLQRKIYRNIWDKKLSVSVSFAKKELTEGEMGEVLEIIENRKRLPLTMLKVKFQTSRNLIFEKTLDTVTSDQYYRNDVFQIGGGERIIRRLPFLAKKRGYYQIRNMDLVGSDLFLSEEMTKQVAADASLYVYPKCFWTEEFGAALQKLNGEVIVRRHLLEDPFTYRGIREYQPYDEVRSINWKATAKSGNLMVNQKDHTSMQTIGIVLNLEDEGIWKKEREAEVAIQIVMGLAVYFLAQGMKVSLFSNAKDTLTKETVFLDGGAGIGQQEAFGKILARIDVHEEAQAFLQFWKEVLEPRTNDEWLFFVSPNGYPEFLEILKQCDKEQREYRWICPYYETEPDEFPLAIAKKVHMIKLERC